MYLFYIMFFSANLCVLCDLCVKFFIFVCSNSCVMLLIIFHFPMYFRAFFPPILPEFIAKLEHKPVEFRMQ